METYTTRPISVNAVKEAEPISESIKTIDAPPKESGYFTGKRLFIVHSGILLSILLIALDQSIVAIAIPRIVSEFHALSSVSWIASAYFLTQASFLLLCGKLLAIFPTKYVYLTTITLFELGSIVCAVAMDMNTLIFGRALSGVGAAGIFTSALAIIAEIAPIEKASRPLLFGSFGVDFGLAAVLGPLLGTQHQAVVSLLSVFHGGKWCFYINAPIGGLSFAMMVFFLKADCTALNRSEASEYTVLQRWLRLDWFGTTLCLAIVSILPLPLQWGGVTKAWRDPTVIALFCASGVVLIAFIILEWKMGKRAIFPLYMFRRRTQVGCCLIAFFVYTMLSLGVYYLPLIYQAKGHSAIQSGIDVIPFMLALVFGESISGGLISVMGRYWYWLALSPPIATIGAGLLFTMNVHTPQRYLIGYQIMYGFGIGGALQTTWIAVQAEYHSEENMIPQSTSLIMFAQLVGGVVGMAITGSVFANQLVKELAELAPHLAPDVAHSVQQSVSYMFTLPLDEQEAVITAYSRSLDYVWSLGVPCGVLASLASFMVRNYDLMKM